MGPASRLAAFAGSLGSDGRIQCALCPKRCRIPEGLRGACGTREHRDGALVAANYGRVAALALDPVEKKPLYHFKPGANLLSIGAAGCNLSCSFCQNWHLAHPPAGEIPGDGLGPRGLVKLLEDYRDANCAGVAYTYSEPLMWYEYIMDAAPLVREAGYQNVLVTNGFAETEPWSSILEWIDACNIDVKGFDPDFYRRECGGELGVVRRNVEFAVNAGVHVEITLLVIPEGTDDPERLQEMVDWLSGMDENIPLHIARYFPHHRMRRAATPLGTLLRVQEMAMQKLNNVFLGNVALPDGSDTTCSGCGHLLIERNGRRVKTRGVTEAGHCAKCGKRATVVW